MVRIHFGTRYQLTVIETLMKAKTSLRRVEIHTLKSVMGVMYCTRSVPVEGGAADADGG